MQILPNGRVKIRNFETNEEREVSPEELPSYGGDALLDQYIKLRKLNEDNGTSGNINDYFGGTVDTTTDVTNYVNDTPVTNTITPPVQAELPQNENIVEEPEKVVRGTLTQNLGTGLLDKIGNFLFPAAKNVAKDIGTSAGIWSSKDFGNASKSMQEAQDAVVKQIVMAQKETDPVKKAFLLKVARQSQDQLAQIAKEGEPDWSPDTGKSIADRSLATAGELAPFSVSWGAKGASALPRIVSMTGQGAMASGARTATSLEPMTPEERITNTVKSMLVGGVTAGTLQSLGELYGFIKSRGTGIPKVEKDINNFKMEANSRDPLGELNQVNESIDRNLGRGSAMEKLNRFPDAMKNIGKQIDDELINTQKPLDLNKIKSDFTEDFLNNSIYGGNDPKVASAWEELLSKVDDISGNTPAEIAQSVYKLKSELPITPILKKISNSVPLTPIEEARFALWTALKSNLDEVSPLIRQLNNDQHLLMLSKEGLIKSAEKAGPSLPIPGTLKGVNLPISNETAQKISSARGSILPNVGNKLPEITQDLTPALKGIPPVVSGSANLIPADNTQQPQNQYGNNDASSNIEHNGIITQNVNSVKSGQDNTRINQLNQKLASYSEAYEKAVLKGDKKNAEAIKGLYDQTNEEYSREVAAQKSLNVKDSSQVSDLKASLVIAKDLTSVIDKFSGVMGPINGKIRSLNPYDTDAQDFQSQMMAVAQTIGRAMEGGVLRAEDIPKYRKILPSIDDTKEIAKRKIDNVIKLIDSQIKSRSNQTSDALPPITQSGFNSPAVGQTVEKKTTASAELPPITQKFGNYSNVERFSNGYNRGVDLGVNIGTPLKVPDGKWEVIEAYGKARPKGYLGNGDNSGWGNSVVVKNTKTGETLRYSHLSKVVTKPGEILEGGKIIGKSGSTGNVTGAHLDLEYTTPKGQLADASKTKYISQIF
jgi:murein DD-endopeptidase MepM/ murein hydrolase activator NlpD